jgi:hypothetical protein
MAEDWRRDATDKMTFGEMKKTDIDNLTLVTKKCKEYMFENLKDALMWTNETMQAICVKMGVDKNGTINRAMQMPLDSLPIKQVINECPPQMRGQVDYRKLYAAKMLDIKLKEADIQIEDRKYNDAINAWRTGHYFYHHNEIAYFISAPYRRKGGHYQTPHVIVPAFGKWFIQSNWMELVKVVS